MPASMSPTPHDELFKMAFSRPANAAGLLRAVLPPALRAQLDLGALRSGRSDFIDEVSSNMFADLVYEVPLAGRPALVCFVLHEHQSTVDRLMAVRLLRYVGGLWRTWLAANPEADRVPAVIPVVLYHGARPWDAPLSLRETIDLPEAGLVAAGDHLPALRFVLDDLARIPDTDLQARETAVFGRLALMLLKRGRWLRADGTGPGSLWAFLTSMVSLVAALPDRADRQFAFMYIIRVVEGTNRQVLETTLRAFEAPEIREDVMNAAEELRREGRREGKLEGRLEGTRGSLCRQLRIKFGPLPAAAQQRVDAADEATLDRWLEAVLTAQRLDDVLGA